MKNVAIELGCELGNELSNSQGFIFAHTLAVKHLSFFSDLEASVFLLC